MKLDLISFSPLAVPPDLEWLLRHPQHLMLACGIVVAMVWKVTDPKAKEDRKEYDDAGRLTKTIENWVASPSTPDQNKETQFTYTADSKMATLVAVNSTTGNQTTTWTYGTTLTDSDLASNDLLRYKQYPDGSSSDRVEYKCNRQGEVKEIEDQLGGVRVLEYDLLGRLQHDRVTTLGTGVDGAVRRITRTYEVRWTVTIIFHQ